ncbi:MAG: GNAT family N-acetyltransferase [Terracidiphilus sp.]|jgi:predicted GNAT superfamily acetyltransferase
MSTALDSHPAQKIVIRPMNGIEDFQKAEQVQRAAWRYDDIDVTPAAIFSVARNFGGQALGAFDEDRMVGFALSLGAVDGGHAHFHSHMVAVVPAYQNQGLGRLIKVAQREDALSRGIDQIVWTFDPLQFRNAYFNFVRLGGVGVRYIPNLYGMTSSPLHGGMPTDRLVIEWNLNSPQVERALSDAPCQRPADAVAVEIPSTASDVAIELRLAGQTRLRSQLMRLMDDGYVITGFEGNEEAASYILEKLKSGISEKL